MLKAAARLVLAVLMRLALGAVTAWQAGRAAKAAGRAEAVAEGREAAARSARIARREEAQAETRHRADATDAAFDLDFRRD